MSQTTLIGKLLLGALYISIAVAIVATAILVVSVKNSHQSRVSLGGEEIVVTLANTPELQAKGLSGYKGLMPNEGMLFRFQKPGMHGFWMKDMLFPIDIIWFDENKRIVDSWENATPESYPQIYTPRTESQFVLEVPDGFYLKHNLKIGNKLEIL